MNRRVAARAGAIAIAIATLGCRALDDLPPIEGSIDISFVNTTHLHISQIDYRISGNGIAEIAGSVSLVDNNATASSLVGGLPPGLDYLLELRATSDDGMIGFCYGAAAFDVFGGQSTPVAITLVCTTDRKVRTIVVDGYTDYCPSLASYAASPPVAPVGGKISLSATAFSYYSDPLMFGWTASAGMLANTNTAVTTYTCTVPGMHVLTVVVTDGFCPDTAMVQVTCVVAPDGGAQDAASL